MTFFIYNINWDVLESEKEILGLPIEVTINLSENTWDMIKCDFDDYIADYLSDQYGYCLLGFDYETI